jgi:hypothetical protein
MADGELTQRDILLGLDKKVDTLMIQMATAIANLTNNDDSIVDHERRIRSLERFRYAFPSLSVLSFLVAVGTLVAYLLAARL